MLLGIQGMEEVLTVVQSEPAESYLFNFKYILLVGCTLKLHRLIYDDQSVM